MVGGWAKAGDTMTSSHEPHEFVDVGVEAGAVRVSELLSLGTKGTSIVTSTPSRASATAIDVWSVDELPPTGDPVRKSELSSSAVWTPPPLK